jgi:hypothetical protein
MTRALQILTGRRFTVEEYVDEFGTKKDGNGNLRVRPTVVCVACRQPMHTVSENIPSTARTWGHNPDPNAWCPLKQSAGERYEILPPIDPNPEAGAAIRSSFFENWEHHWAHTAEIVPMVSIFLFINFIKEADRKKLWENRGMQEWFLPYIFLSMYEIEPPHSATGRKTRPHWVRCRFDARVRTFGDLWIRPQGDWGFIRSEYRVPPRGGVPGPTHLIDTDPVTPDPDFLARVKPYANSFERDKMKSNFPVEIA